MARACAQPEFRMTAPQTGVVPVYLHVAPADIALIKFLFESYEEVAIVRTLDRHAATIVVLIVPDALAVARGILAALQSEISCVEIPAPEGATDDWLMRAMDE